MSTLAPIRPLTPTDDDLAMYQQKGYWVSPPLLDSAHVAALREAHDRLWAGDFDTDAQPLWPDNIKAAYESHALRQLINGWWLNNTIRDLVTDGGLGRIAARFLGCERVRLWHDQVIYKPPTGSGGNAGNVGWHQDYGFWHAADTQNMVTVWIALQDTDLTNGGMRSIAGSHRWGLVEDSDTFFDQDLDGLEARFGHLGQWADEPCVIPAGGASFHHALTFHGSGPNRSDRPRLSVVAHLMPDGAAYSGARQHHRNVQMLGPRPHVGQRFDNAFFPLLDR